MYAHSISTNRKDPTLCSISYFLARYIVVCDVYRYVSESGSLIEFAEEERKTHIANTSCDSRMVLLEENLSRGKIPKMSKLKK